MMMTMMMTYAMLRFCCRCRRKFARSGSSADQRWMSVVLRHAAWRRRRHSTLPCLPMTRATIHTEAEPHHSSQPGQTSRPPTNTRLRTTCRRPTMLTSSTTRWRRGYRMTPLDTVAMETTTPTMTHNNNMAALTLCAWPDSTTTDVDESRDSFTWPLDLRGATTFWKIGRPFFSLRTLPSQFSFFSSSLPPFLCVFLYSTPSFKPFFFPKAARRLGERRKISAGGWGRVRLDKRMSVWYAVQQTFLVASLVCFVTRSRASCEKKCYEGTCHLSPCWRHRLTSHDLYWPSCDLWRRHARHARTRTTSLW